MWGNDKRPRRTPRSIFLLWTPPQLAANHPVVPNALMMTKHIILIGLIAALARAIGAANHEPELAEAIQTIRAVGPEGRGNADAARAWKKLAAGNSTYIVPLLAGMDDAHDLAVNWFRSAVFILINTETTES